MTEIDPRLVTPLQRIAALALSGTGTVTDEPLLDLFYLRGVLHRAPEQVVAFLRAEVERLTGGRRTVRAVDGRALRPSLGGIGAIRCAVCPFSTPEGKLTAVEPNMFVFAVTGAQYGYLTRR